MRALRHILRALLLLPILLSGPAAGTGRAKGRVRTERVIPRRPTYLWHRALNEPAPLEYAPRERAAPRWDARTGAIYVGDRFGTFYALDAAGHTRWTWRAKGPIEAEAVLSGDRVYVVSTAGEVVALDRHTGRALWRYRIEAELATPPTLAGDLLLVPSLGDTVTALDAARGTFRWFYRRPPPPGMTIRGAAGVRVAGETVYTAFSDGTVVALEGSTGNVVWERTFGASGGFVDIDTTPCVLGDRLYVASYAGTLMALDRRTGTLVWSAPTVQGAMHLACAERRLLVLGPGAVWAHDRTLEGQVVWRTRVPGGPPSLPALAGGRLVFGTEEGGVFALSVATGRPLRAFAPGPGVAAPPALGPSGAVVFSNGGWLYRIAWR